MEPQGSTSDGESYKVERARRRAIAIAHRSWILGLLGILASSFVKADDMGTVRSQLGLVGMMGLAFVALGHAMVALARMRRLGRAGILGPALAGLILGGAPTALFAYGLVKNLGAERADPAQEAAREFLEAPGWVGVLVTAGGARIVVVEPDATSPSERRIAGFFEQPFSPLPVVVDNTFGTAEVKLDLSRVTIDFHDGTHRSGYPHEAVMAYARPAQRDEIQRTWVPVHSVARGEKSARGMVFLPAGIDLRTADSVTLSIDGARVIVPGKYYDLAGKRELQRRAAAAAGAHDHPISVDSGPQVW